MRADCGKVSEIGYVTALLSLHHRLRWEASQLTVGQIQDFGL